MLYALADEIRAEEGCTTVSAEIVEESAERLDTQTVTMNALVASHKRMVEALETIARTSTDKATGRLAARTAAAHAWHEIEQDLSGLVVKESLTTETTAPAIIFYPAGSLGEEVQP